MPLAVGIDEAGYGPLLGPLVVAGTIWQVSPRAATADYWTALRGAVGRKSTERGGLLPVDDSKRVYDRKQGLHTLERSVLAFAAAAGMSCGSLAEFLAALGATPSAVAPQLPWYANPAVPLPVDRLRSAYAAGAVRLERAMASSGVRCRGLLAQLVSETTYNERLRRTRNKAVVLLEQVLRLIARAAERCEDQDVFIYVDRLGGRQDYRRLLLEAFPERHLHVEEVSETASRYRLATQRNDWHIQFIVDADRQHLPVALASMAAKYLRELVMRQFNAFWRQWLPELAPTAGYYRDAQRFLADIRPALPRCGLRPEQFIRQR